MAIKIRVILEAMNHPQPPTPIKTDNYTSTGFIYNKSNRNKPKSWDMQYYWIRYRDNQRQFKVRCERG